MLHPASSHKAFQRLPVGELLLVPWKGPLNTPKGWAYTPTSSHHGVVHINTATIDRATAPFCGFSPVIPQAGWKSRKIQEALWREGIKDRT